jgi:ubiquinone/menaquinone biosynthesis C-methylase UbiE
MTGAGEILRAHYEDYPYPPRDPADEKNRLVVGSPSHLDEINHYLWAGRLKPEQPFRALVAGGGTGDAVIMLAQQLKSRGFDADIVYLDLSEPSMAVARARADIRGLDTIRFRIGSLLDLDPARDGPFDYIDCCGVLHHLPDPAAGLHRLAGVLAADGGMGVMLYGSLGRTGVYPLQDSLRALAGTELAGAERLSLTRRVLADLPRQNWFRRNPYLGDHDTGDDAALYDLLLHSRDRAYRVPEIAALAATAGLVPTGFIEPVRYDPDSYLDDPVLRQRAAHLTWLERAALAENLSGALKTHVFYLTRSARADQAVVEVGAGAVPVVREQDPAVLAKAIAKDGTLSADFDGQQQTLRFPDRAADVVGLCDGQRNLDAIQQSLGMASADFSDLFGATYRPLNGLNLMLLRLGS